MNFSSLHSSFFSSLKQVEKRLKLENTHQQQQQHQHNTTQSSSLGTPLYVLPSPSTSQRQQPIIHNHNNEDADSSEPPQAFLLHSLSSYSQQQQPQTPNNITPDQQKYHHHHDDGHCHGHDDISMLIQLLGLSLSSDEDECNNSSGDDVVSEHGMMGFNGEDVCECGDGFYEKIVGVKGPKCKEEVKRMDGWINYLMTEGREPLRLAHLLLGKAAAFDFDYDCGLEFPSTVQEFLQVDPPNHQY